MLRNAEKGRSNQMYAINIEIRELKKLYHRKMVECKAPKRVWEYAMEHAAKMRQFIPRNKLNDRTPIESITGNTPDVSEYLDFDFWDLVWYFPNAHPSISVDDRALGRWVGVSHRVGSDMSYWIMPVSGKTVSDTTVQHVTRDDMLKPEVNEKIM